MLLFLKKYRFFFLCVFILSTVIISIFYTILKPKKTLPIYNPSDVNPELVDSTVQYIRANHRIADFAFINQNGKTITQKNYENKIYVADFFFTTCPTICPIMTTNMIKLQKEFQNNFKIMFLSHSVTPDIDQVPILKAYAQNKGVLDYKWNLVTGDKKAIYKMARTSYLAVKTENIANLYDMVHTENFILVDTKRRIRGFYDGTSDHDIKRLIEDIHWLSENE